MPLAPDELSSALRGLLSFPLTPFTSEGGVNEEVLREHVSRLVDTGATGRFAAGGTGEFFSLSATEYEEVTRICVDEVAGRVPVLGGLGYGVGQALEFAERGVRAGVDGFLVLPPYLIAASQEGLEAHYRGLSERIPRGLIIYQRDNARFEVETVKRLAAIENVIGFKDGVGQTEQIALLVQDLDLDEFLVLNGMPTAELHARNFAAHGVTTYSSALLDFVPEVAVRFNRALLEDDVEALDHLRREFIVPFSRMRARAPGYAVALVKAGARLRGLPVGGVRAPLVDPSPADERDLRELMSAWISEPLAA
jgi:5-dehydro-4-deoxyglucarate dehydratase